MIVGGCVGGSVVVFYVEDLLMFGIFGGGVE